MTAGDLITQVYQYEYNGLLIGCGTEFFVQNVKGLLGFPAVRSGTFPRFGNHGAVPGKHYLPERQFVVELDYTPMDDDTFAANRSALMQAFGPRVNPQDELPFCFWHPGSTQKLQISCRPVDYNFEVNRRFALKFPETAIRFEASDPLHYTVTQFSTSITLTPDTTGLTFPIDFPLNFGASSSNEAGLFNGGTAPANWTATIAGSIEGPRLERSDTGQEINLPNLTVPGGETLVIDSAARTILLNGTANRRQFLTKASRWFKLDPGATTSIRFSANGAVSGASVTFNWRWAFYGES